MGTNYYAMFRTSTDETVQQQIKDRVTELQAEQAGGE